MVACRERGRQRPNLPCPAQREGGPDRFPIKPLTGRR
jgi:hypothetical protein